MIDEELDELILNRLRHRRTQADRASTGDATQSPADMAVFFNEPENRVETRIRVLAQAGKIKESTAAPDRWMIA